MYRGLSRPPGTEPPQSGRSLLVPAIAVVVFAGVVAAAVFGGPPFVRLIVPGADLPSLRVGSIVDDALDLVGGPSFDGAAGDEGTPTPQATPETGTETPTPEPTPDVPLESVTGSPHSATAVAQAWRGAGYQVEQTVLDGDAYSGLAGQPVGLRLQSGANSLLVAAIVYETSDAVREDWNLGGERPQLRSGRGLPSYETVWWNRNVVAVILERSGTTSQALDAFIGMGR